MGFGKWAPVCTSAYAQIMRISDIENLEGANTGAVCSIGATFCGAAATWVHWPCCFISDGKHKNVHIGACRGCKSLESFTSLYVISVALWLGVQDLYHGYAVNMRILRVGTVSSRTFAELLNKGSFLWNALGARVVFGRGCT